ncbi:MAG TPA: prepilin-type N-terminal cleavage/methylation domain-containing protein [Candidatus Eisenbacteria bacterium]
MNVPVRTRPPARGFTVIELLLALTLASLLVGVISMAFYRTTSEVLRLRDVTDRRQNARTAVQLIERETRMAGSGWGRIPVYGNNSSGAAVTLQAVVPGFTSIAADDSVLLVGAWQISTTVASGMPSQSSNLQVQDVTGFSPNDLVLITNGLYANMVQVSATNTSSEHLQLNPASPYNSPGGFKVSEGHWPAGGYGVGSTVEKLTLSSYYMDRTSFRKPALMRHEYGQSPQVAAYNVDGFRVWYQMQDGTWTRNPQNMVAVEKIMPVVATRLSDPRRPALVDSVWAALKPRSF